MMEENTTLGPKQNIIVNTDMWREIGGFIGPCLGQDSLVFERECHGGLINKSALFRGSRGNEVTSYFVKYNDQPSAKALLELEYESLQLIARTNTVKTPKVFTVQGYQPTGGVVFVEEGLENMTQSDINWWKLGSDIARLHSDNLDKIRKDEQMQNSIHHKQSVTDSGQGSARHDGPVHKFGFHMDTYYGDSFHTNGGQWEASWQAYFTRHILKPVFDAVESEIGDRDVSEAWSRLQLKLDAAFCGVEILPSLLHGDLCDINVASVNSQPVVFDAQSSYGHWQFDFTQAQGMGEDFAPEFFDAYHQIVPKDQNFEKRMKLYNVFMFTICFYYMVRLKDDQASQMRQGVLQCIEEYLKMGSC